MRLVMDGRRGLFDLALSPAGGLDEGGQLEESVAISLFTDRTADPAEMTPDLGPDRRGWWADATRPADRRMGSLLWLHLREKKTEVARKKIEDAATEALAWLVEDGLASEANVTATFPRGLPEIVRLDIAVVEPSGVRRNWPVDLIWGELAGG